jgi:hypothetical protein
MHRQGIQLLFLILMVSQAYGQRTTYKGKKLTPLRSYNDPSQVRAKAGSTVPLFDEAGYPYQGIGIKAGDVVALTFKFYISEHFALVADFGRTISPVYRHYYTDLFELYYPDPSDTLAYVSHNVEFDWVGELKLLYQVDATSISRGLWFYAGLGWQMRDTRLEYDFITQAPAEPVELRSLKRHQTQGVTLTAGAEYANFSIPISLFIEAGCFYDMVKDKGWVRLQGGLGMRYVF